MTKRLAAMLLTLTLSVACEDNAAPGNNTPHSDMGAGAGAGEDCQQDSGCAAGLRCVNDRCAVADPNDPNNPNPADPCAADPLCSVDGSGPGTDTPFDLGDGDTSQGVVLGPDGELTLDVEPVPPNAKFIWIANTGQGTVSKVDTVTYQELGRYSTGPQEGGNDPSRTSVNGFGDVFVGNRGAGTVTKIRKDGAGCPDVNMDAQVNTSTGAADVKPWGQDECVAWNTALCSGCLIRAVAAQDLAPNGEVRPVVWVGGFNNRKIWKLDGETGQVLLETDSPVRPYGFALDKAGSLWISGPNWGFEGEPRFFGRVDTNRCVDDASCNVEVCDEATPGCVKQRFPVDFQPYGITVDNKQRVWLAGDRIMRFDPATGARDQVTGYEFSHGIAADALGFVYAAAYGTGVVQVNAEDLSQHRVIPATAGSSKGLGVDADGKIWSINQNSSDATVVQPGATINDSMTVATVSGFVAPYTYSDMTGQQLQFATDRAGFYRQRFQACNPAERYDGTTWKQLRWQAQTSDRGSIRLRLRAAQTQEGLASTAWEELGELPPMTSPLDVAPLLESKGWQGMMWIEVEAQLTARRDPDQPVNPPSLRALEMTRSCMRIFQ